MPEFSLYLGVALVIITFVGAAGYKKLTRFETVVGLSFGAALMAVGLLGFLDVIGRVFVNPCTLAVLAILDIVMGTSRLMAKSGRTWTGWLFLALGIVLVATSAVTGLRAYSG